MMKEGAYLINVSRGGLLDTEAAIDALERGQIGCLCVLIASWLCAPCHNSIHRLVQTAETAMRPLALPLQGHGRV